MNIAGIDGCPKGWIIIRNREEEIYFNIYERFSELMNNNLDLDRIFIDIPIGLPGKFNPRSIEELLRKELKGKASSVFNVPVKEAVYETDNAKAREINIEQTGKSLSIQSLNIRNKIREVDSYLCSTNRKFSIFESHPELCFKKLNPDGKTLFSKKSTREGAEERFQTLILYEKRLSFILRKIEEETRRKDVKRDDILDAICLFISNKLAGDSQLSFLQDHPVQIINGREVKIAYYS